MSKQTKPIAEKITPLVVANNTIVRKKMTEKEYKLVHEVSNNWINWIKKNS